MTEEAVEPEDATLALAEAIRSAALGVPGVLDLSPGIGFVEATYGRNRAVYGVGLQREPESVGVDLHVVVAEEPIPEIVQRLREVVRTRVQEESGLPAEPINLWVDDINLGVHASNRKDSP